MSDRLESLIGEPNDVDYEYLNQDPVPIKIYSPGADTWQDTTLPQEPVDFDRFVKNYRDLGTHRTRKIFEDPHTGRRVVVRFANTDQLDTNPDELTALYTTRTSSLDTNGGNRREDALVATKNPDRPFVIIDSPGTGISSLPPRKAKNQAVRTGSFIEIARISVGALNDNDYFPTAFSGTGYGARMALGAAAISEAGQVKRIGMIDPEGQSNLGFWAQQKAMLRELLIHNGNAQKVTTDPYTKPHENFPDLPKEWEENSPLGVATRLVLNRTLWHQYVTLPRAFAKGQPSLRGDIEAALEQQETAFLDYVSPEKSELLLNPDDPLRTLGGLANSQAVRTRLIRVVRVPEATHYFTSAHPRLVGALLWEALG
jgi:hypothetical protein